MSSHSTLSLSDVEERCKQAASLKLPLSRVELNIEEVRELFQVSSTDVTLINITSVHWCVHGSLELDDISRGHFHFHVHLVDFFLCSVFVKHCKL